MNNKEIIEKFYSAFQAKDYETMRGLYHQDAEFNDEVFSHLNSYKAGKMWEMLLKNGKDLSLSFSNINADNEKGSAFWEASYTFSKTGRKVINKINAEFIFKDGKILKHHDRFNFSKWASQAFGFTGAILGRTSFFRGKVRNTAMENLEKFIEKNP